MIHCTNCVLSTLWQCLPQFLTIIIINNNNNRNNNALPIEQKGCRRKSRDTKDQLLIDKMVLADCKRKHENLAMAWVDYKKAYDMVPHS